MSDQTVPTLEEFDAAVMDANRYWGSANNPVRLLSALRPLVEEADYKRRVADAGWDWMERRQHGVSIRDNASGWLPMQSWPAAAEYAEAHAVKRCHECGAVIQGE